MAKQRVATAVIELETDASTMRPGLEVGKKQIKGFGEEVSRTLEATEKDAKALSAALSNVFGTDLQRRAMASADAIKQVGGASKLTDTEAKKHLATLDAWIAKANLLGKEVPADILKTRDALVRTNAEIGKTPTQVSSVASTLKGFAASMGIVFSVGLIKNWVSGVIDAASNVNDLSKKLGVSAEAVQRWSYAAELSGGSIETVDRAVKKMNEQLAEGDKSTIGALKKAGLSFDQIRRMKPEDAFNAIVKALEGIEDPMTRARIATQLFGKAGQELLPAIAEGFGKAGASAKVMSDETIKRLDAAGDAWVKLTNIVTIYTGEAIGMSMEIFEGAIAAIERMTKGWRKFAETVQIIAAGSLSGSTGIQNALRMLSALDKAEAGKGAKTETPAQAEERRRKAVAAALAAAKAALDEEEADKRATKAKEERLEVDKRIAAARVTLTASQQKEITQLLQLGISHSDIAKKLNVSEIAVRKFDDANKELSKTLDTLAKQRIEPIKRELRDYLNIITGIDQIPLIKRDTLTDLRTGSLNDLLGVDPATGEIKNPLDQLRTDNYLAWVQTVGGASRTVTQEIDKTRVKVGELGSALHALGQSVGGGAGSLLSGIGGMVTAWQLYDSQLDKSMTKTQKASALIQGAAQVWSATGQGEGSGKGALSGAMAGMQAGMVFGPYGAAIGAAAGALTGLIRGMNDGREAVKKYAASMGGFEELQKRLNALGAEGQRLSEQGTKIGRGNTQQAKEWIKAVEDAFARAEQRTAAFNGSLGTMLVRIKDLGVGLPASLRTYLSELERGGRLTQENIDLLAQLSGDGEADWNKIAEAVQRYGGDISKLGGTFQSQRLHDAWQQVIDDMDLFAAGGISAGDALELTKKKVIELIQQSMAFGVELPENVRLWALALIETGELVDANGKKIEESQLRFGETMQTSIQKLTAEIKRLVDELLRVPNAIGAIPRTVDVDVNYRSRRDPDLDPYGQVPEVGPGYARLGGFVTAQGVQRFGSGGLVRSIFRRSGTDTQPAMLTPGEGVLNLSAMSLIGRDGLRALNSGRLSTAAGATAAGGPVSVTIGDIHVGVENAQGLNEEQLAEKLALKIPKKIEEGGLIRTLWHRQVGALAGGMA